MKPRYIIISVIVIIVCLMASCFIDDTKPPTEAPTEVPIQTSTLMPTPTPTETPTETSTETSTALPSYTAEITPTATKPTLAPTPTVKPRPTPQGSFEIPEFSFPGRFTDSEVITENSYTSPNLSVTVEKKVLNEGAKNIVTYYVADIYVRYLDCLFTGTNNGEAIAQSTMHTMHNAVLSVNGDNYLAGAQSKQPLIHNGVVVRDNPPSLDTCVLYYDGTMETFSPADFSMDEIIAKGAYQQWAFGPMLLKNGEKMTTFNCAVNKANPRTCIGYYEPGHYCLVVVDGRASGYSVGLTTKQLSELFYDMGCKAAYNFDGGRTSMMFFMGKLINSPYDGGRSCYDVVCVSNSSYAVE